MTRPLADIQHDLSAVAYEFARWEGRRAHLLAELAEALRATDAAPPARPAPAPAEYLTTAEAAELLGVSTRLLKRLRATGDGPLWTRVGRSVRYSRYYLENFQAAAKNPESNAGRALQRNAVRSPFAPDGTLPSGVRPAQ